ncbi:MAG: RagB/SusD family nutrient uptake outer membrane protein, partial [Bacteroidota bacterium]
MKKVQVLFLLLALGFASCEEYLEEGLTGGVTADGVYDSPAGIELGLNAAYTAYTRLMGNANNREDGWSLTTMGTDMFQNGSDGGQKRYNRYDDIEPGHNTITNAWEDLYIGINTANAVIGRAPNVIMNSERLADIMGQARFLRGIYYFWLVRQYGAVHYSDEETVGVETEANRTPVPELYARIIEDMEFAAENLPGQQSERG